MEKRKLQLDDLYRIKHNSEPQITEDGTKVAYVQTVTSKEENRYINTIKLYESGEIKTISENSSSPRWYKKDSLIYLKEINSKKQIVVKNILSGEEKQLTSMEYGVDMFSISPNEKKICFIAKKYYREKDNNLGIKFIDKLQVKDDGVKGFKDVASQKQIYVLEIETETVTQITDNEFVLEAPVWYTNSVPTWSNDSSKLSFISRIQDHEKRDEEPWSSKVYVIDTDTKKISVYGQDSSVYLKPVWLSDKELLCQGHHNEYKRATDFGLYKINIETGQEENIVKDFKGSLEDYCNTDSQLGAIQDRVVINKDKKEAYFTASHMANTDLFKVNLETREIINLNKEQRRIYGFSCNKDFSKIAIVYATIDDPSKIAILNPDTLEEELIVNENKEFFDEVKLSIPETTWFESEDYLKMQGWIMKAVDSKEGEKNPTLLQIHGGPFTFYGNAFHFEFQLFAANGYNVIYSNPRGSKGYGQEIATAVIGYYSTRDYNDLMTFVDHCIEKYDCIDVNRLAVTGGSYGGYMTNWIVSQTDRFIFGITQRSISNWMTMFATSDMGYVGVEQMKLGRKPRRIEELLEMSPITYVKQINTPLLILHSELDMRCPIEQAEQLFVAMKYYKKDVRMVRFPNSSHGLSRNGIPALKYERLKYMIDYALEKTPIF